LSYRSGTVEEIRDVWPGLLPNLPAPPTFAEKLIQRWKSLSLTKEIVPDPGEDADDVSAPAPGPR
jgi:hypothetical protein